MSEKPLLALISEIWKSEEPIDKSASDGIDLQSEVTAISSDPEYARSIVDALEQGKPEGGEPHLNYIEFCRKGTRVRGVVPGIALYAKLGLLGIEDRSDYICEMISISGYSLFLLIDTLEISLRNLEFETDRLKEFFECGIERVGNDMTAGRFYRNVETFVRSHPEQAEVILGSYLKHGDTLSDQQRVFCTLLLGHFRTHHPIEELDESFRTSDHLKLRMCHHRSWSVSIPIEQEWQETQPVLDRICVGEIEEKDAALRLALSLSASRDADFEAYLTSAFTWFRSKIGTEQTPDLKFEFFNHAELMCVHAKPEASDCLCSEIVKTMSLLFPIPIDHEGTWGKCFGMLAQMIDRSEVGFIEALDQLVESDIGGVVEHFRYENDYVYLLNKMQEHAEAMGPAVTRYCFSADRKQRRFGLHLFDVLNMDQFVDPSEEITPSHVCLALLEFRLSTHLEDAITRFYLAVEPFAGKSNESKALFREHVRNEALNYPGGCVEYWGEHVEPDSMLREAIQFQEAYFEAFKDQEVMKGIRSVMPHIQSGIHLRSRKQASQLRKSMEESRSRSPLQTLIKNVNLYYGEEFANVAGGKISDSQPMTKHSHSMALPRLPEIDPEGEFIDRMHLLAGIRKYEGKVKSDD
ncbi:MAG: hypothetical protein CML13_09530 [Puniceicoccaceae bacterium]|nr:hypothetical protein [Puniceicoccaceae bacterium]